MGVKPGQQVREEVHQDAAAQAADRCSGESTQSRAQTGARAGMEVRHTGKWHAQGYCTLPFPNLARLSVRQPNTPAWISGPLHPCPWARCAFLARVRRTHSKAAMLASTQDPGEDLSTVAAPGATATCNDGHRAHSTVRMLVLESNPGFLALFTPTPGPDMRTKHQACTLP